MINYLDLVKESKEDVENIKQQVSHLELVIDLLNENLIKTAKENQELRETNAIYRKQLYDVDFIKY